MEKELLGRLFVTNEAEQEQQLELYSSAVITIGRSQENTIYVSGETVSRRHAELRVLREGVQFKNLGRNGAVVDNKSIYHSEWLALSSGSMLEIGACKMRLQLLVREDTKIIGQTIMLPLSNAPTPAHSGTMVFPMPHKPRASEPQPDKLAAVSPLAPKLSFRLKLQKLLAPLFKTPISRACTGLAAFIVVLYICAPAKEKHSVAASSKSEATKPGNASTTPPPASVGQSAPVRDEDLETAVALFNSAEKLYVERTLNRRNLYDSAQKWREAASIFLAFSRRAGDQAQQAESQLQRQIEEWKNDYVLSFEKKEYQVASTILQNIIASVPNFDEANYRWAKEQERELQALFNQPKP